MKIVLALMSLACAILPNDGMNFARMKIQRDSFERTDSAESLGDIAKLEQGGRH